MAWNASNNNVFFQRLKNWAKQYQDIRDEGQRLDDLWNGEGISGDPAFVDNDGITTAEATALITMLGDVEGFTTNQVVSQGDRIPTLTPFIVED